ncbi:hypothetical protein M422DRAFT_34625 [Sphaerobolus stellatus SS14]|uniref:F-box domain-containing protein n=1 Tax=Sphaerobolus stellatus (strain SS14) TaxID=990650 RepID=A0A0C9V1P3_SPHS4|nr:hypothetical protein M422DRAFT_34625 [Sphaerobolus stellatus SS14]
MTHTPPLPTELLHLVFTFCSNPTLFSSCRVSKAWLEPALSVLWKDVPHPTVLFRLLEPWDAKVTFEATMGKFSRPLRPRDWDAFDRYASRVRSVNWNERDSDITDGAKISRPVLAEIARIKPRFTLLPALCKLTVNAEHMDYMTLFLHPGLKELEIKFDNHGYSRGYNGVEGVVDGLQLIPAFAPGLQVLDVHCPYSVSLFNPLFCAVLRSLTSLKNLILPRYWLTDRVVEALGSLPHLERFNWRYDRGGGGPVDLVGFSATLQGQDSFSALSHFSLELDFSVVRTFLDQSTVLERLSSLDITTINRAPPLEIHQFLQMCAERSMSLKKLSVDGFPNEPTSVGVEDIINMQILEPILSCHNLTNFTIHYPTPLHLSEDDLHLIGIKLPKLRSLLLAESPFHLHPPLLSLSALLLVLEHYPHLEEIGLYLDGNSSFVNPAKLVKPHPTLRQFSVGASPLLPNNVGKVSLFLSRLMSTNLNSGTLGGINYSMGYDPSYEDTLSSAELRSREEFAGAWEDVDLKLPTLVAARDEERRIYEEILQSRRDQN